MRFATKVRHVLPLVGQDICGRHHKAARRKITRAASNGASYADCGSFAPIARASSKSSGWRPPAPPRCPRVRLFRCLHPTVPPPEMDRGGQQAVESGAPGVRTSRRAECDSLPRCAAFCPGQDICGRHHTAASRKITRAASKRASYAECGSFAPMAVPPAKVQVGGPLDSK
jgi:hypothetical protein